jgi:hypothetical protein
MVCHARSLVPSFGGAFLSSDSKYAPWDRQRRSVVYPRETQEMVFDAHDRAFALFKCKFASNTDPLRGDIASNSDPF